MRFPPEKCHRVRVGLTPFFTLSDWTSAVVGHQICEAIRVVVIPEESRPQPWLHPDPGSREDSRSTVPHIVQLCKKGVTIKFSGFNLLLASFVVASIHKFLKKKKKQKKKHYSSRKL